MPFSTKTKVNCFPKRDHLFKPLDYDYTTMGFWFSEIVSNALLFYFFISYHKRVMAMHCRQ